jgi:hypothetical protein
MAEYTPSRIKEVLKDLRIEPLKTNLVDSTQAAAILTWRLKDEQGIEQTYTTTALRRRISTGKLKVQEQINPRLNLYDVRDVFELSLMPGRAEGTRQRVARKEKQTSLPS